VLLFCLATPILWWAVHHFPWLGPALADGLRRVIGTEGVTRLEETAYAAEDRINQWTRSDEAPRAYWEVPSALPDDAKEPPDVSPSGSASATVGAVAPHAPAPEPAFRPVDVGPRHRALAAAGDGVWVPIEDPAAPHESVFMAKTLIHPDRGRPWAELFVVAVDTEEAEIHLVAGSREPRATVPEARSVERPAVIPLEHRATVVAAFNGGFKTEHGRWGMRIGAVTYVAARPHGCTFSKQRDGVFLRIAPWEEIEHLEHALSWWRETPPCMIRDGERHGALWDPDAKGWGAALEGDTVIRRSAVGLSEDQETLYVGMSNHTTAQALADGMKHAGAANVAQLDVNWSYPKFVLFPLDESGRRVATSLFEGFKVDSEEYLREPSRRDFFYLVRRDPNLVH